MAPSRKPLGLLAVLLVLAAAPARAQFCPLSADDTAQRITPDIHTNSGHIDGWAPFAEVQTVTYYLTSASDGGSTKNLVRATNRNLLSASTETTIDAQVLLTGISTAAISSNSTRNPRILT